MILTRLVFDEWSANSANHQRGENVTRDEQLRAEFERIWRAAPRHMDDSKMLCWEMFRDGAVRRGESTARGRRGGVRRANRTGNY